jgi:hypothetical protein
MIPSKAGAAFILADVYKKNCLVSYLGFFGGGRCWSAEESAVRPWSDQSLKPDDDDRDDCRWWCIDA